MTTRDDSYRLVDRLDPDDLDTAAAALRVYVDHDQPPFPVSVGMGHSNRGDISEHVDELLRENGFGL
jgi:hypothetical protein